MAHSPNGPPGGTVTKMEVAFSVPRFCFSVSVQNF